MAAFAAIMLAAGAGTTRGIDAIVNSQIIAATPFGLLMLAIAWSLFKAIRTDYREERQQLREITAYDGKVDERRMEEILRRREAGEPVGRTTSGRDD